MRGYHSKTVYTNIDQPQIIVFFKHKNKHIFEARILIRGVPQPNSPPFFLTIVKPMRTNGQELLMITEENLITETSSLFLDLVTN